jgi:hypothetical protein
LKYFKFQQNLCLYSNRFILSSIKMHWNLFLNELCYNLSEKFQMQKNVQKYWKKGLDFKHFMFTLTYISSKYRCIIYYLLCKRCQSDQSSDRVQLLKNTKLFFRLTFSSNRFTKNLLSFSVSQFGYTWNKCSIICYFLSIYHPFSRNIYCRRK